MSLVAVPALLAALAAPSAAQDPAPADPNFSFAGFSSTGEPLTTGADVAGDLAYCTNANGLGSELYFNASGPGGVTVRLATVSPMVIPLHIGIATIVDPTNEAPLADDFVTLGVVEGTPAPFGSVGPSDATYGGLAVARSGLGVMSFSYASQSSDCSASNVMPILEPIIGGTGALQTTTTTAAPTTTAPQATTTTTPPATSSTTTTTAAP